MVLGSVGWVTGRFLCMRCKYIIIDVFIIYIYVHIDLGVHGDGEHAVERAEEEQLQGDPDRLWGK